MEIEELVESKNECEEDLKKADDVMKRLDALEKKVDELEKMIKENEYPLPGKYPYPNEEKKSSTDPKELIDTVTKSITEKINMDQIVTELKKSIDERDAKIKELSDRLEKVESVKLKRSVVESEVLVGEPSLIIKNGEVYKE